MDAPLMRALKREFMAGYESVFLRTVDLEKSRYFQPIDMAEGVHRDEKLISMLASDDNKLKDEVLAKLATLTDPDRIHRVLTKAFEKMKIKVDLVSMPASVWVRLTDAETGSPAGRFRADRRGDAVEAADILVVQRGKRLAPMMYQWWATHPEVRHEFSGKRIIIPPTNDESAAALERAGMFSFKKNGFNDYEATFPTWDNAQDQVKNELLVEMLASHDNRVKDKALAKLATFSDPDRIHAVIGRAFEQMRVDIGLNYYLADGSGRLTLKDDAIHAIGTMKFRKTFRGVQMDVDLHDLMQGRRLGPMMYQWWATHEAVREEFKGLPMTSHGTTAEQVSALERAGLFGVKGADISEIGSFLYRGVFPDWDKVENKGGIDLQKVDLDVKAKGDGVAFKIDPDMLEKVKDAPGFTPVIIGVRPMDVSLSAFLGLKD
jgi:hypothetical protein